MPYFRAGKWRPWATRLGHGRGNTRTEVLPYLSAGMPPSHLRPPKPDHRGPTPRNHFKL